jgi:hypothetical protein
LLKLQAKTLGEITHQAHVGNATLVNPMHELLRPKRLLI